MTTQTEKKTVKKSTPSSRYDIAVLDTETSGLSNNAEVLTLAIILLDGETLEEKGRFESMIRPSSAAVLETTDAFHALRINGLDKEELMKAPTKHEVAQKLWDWKREHGMKKPWVFSGYNVINFDLPKMKYFFWQIRNMTPAIKIEDIFHYLTLDVMNLYMAEKWFKGPNSHVSLKNACKAFKITNEQEHDAMADTEATVDLLRKLMKKQNKLS